MSDKLTIRLHPDLKKLIDAEAVELKLAGGMGELVVQILAAHYRSKLGSPEMGRVPRKRMGRPPKMAVA